MMDFQEFLAFNRLVTPSVDAARGWGHLHTTLSPSRLSFWINNVGAPWSVAQWSEGAVFQWQCLPEIRLLTTSFVYRPYTFDWPFQYAQTYAVLIF